MFEKSDEHNQQILNEQNKGDKPLVSDGAVRVFAWPAYALIALIVVVVAVALIASVFS